MFLTFSCVVDSVATVVAAGLPQLRWIEKSPATTPCTIVFLTSLWCGLALFSEVCDAARTYKPAWMDKFG